MVIYQKKKFWKESRFQREDNEFRFEDVTLETSKGRCQTCSCIHGSVAQPKAEAGEVKGVKSHWLQ